MRLDGVLTWYVDDSDEPCRVRSSSHLFSSQTSSFGLKTSRLWSSIQLWKKTFLTLVPSGRLKTSWAELRIKNVNREARFWGFFPFKTSHHCHKIDYAKKCQLFGFTHHLESSPEHWKAPDGRGDISSAIHGNWLHHFTLPNAQWLSLHSGWFISSCRFDLEHPELGGRSYQPLLLSGWGFPNLFGHPCGVQGLTAVWYSSSEDKSNSSVTKILYLHLLTEHQRLNSIINYHNASYALSLLPIFPCGFSIVLPPASLCISLRNSSGLSFNKESTSALERQWANSGVSRSVEEKRPGNDHILIDFPATYISCNSLFILLM